MYENQNICKFYLDLYSYDINKFMFSKNNQNEIQYKYQS